MVKLYSSIIPKYVTPILKLYLTLCVMELCFLSIFHLVVSSSFNRIKMHSTTSLQDMRIKDEEIAFTTIIKLYTTTQNGYYST